MARDIVKRIVIAATLFSALLMAAVVGGTEASTPTVVLGSPAYAGPQGVGWGSPHPSKIFNGGDPSGLVTHIHWSSWGQASATGHGLNAIYKPAGDTTSHRHPNSATSTGKEANQRRKTPTPTSSTPVTPRETT